MKVADYHISAVRQFGTAGSVPSEYLIELKFSSYASNSMTRTVLIAVASLLLLTVLQATDAGAEEQVNLTWFGFTAFEIASGDYSSVVYANPNIWRYNQSAAFGVALEPQYESPDALAQFLKEKNSKDIVLALTNDHPDEIGDLFELAEAFKRAGLEYWIVAQSDVARNWLVPELEKRGLETVNVLRVGYGGNVIVGDIKITATLALHGSTPWPISMVIEIDGVRSWHSGGTAVFSDMRLIHQLYKPQIALIPISDSQFSIGVREGAYAAKLLRPEVAIPTHYLSSPGQFPRVTTLDDVDGFKEYVEEFTHGRVKVAVPTVGEVFTYPAGSAMHADESIVQSSAKIGEQDQTVYLAGTGTAAFVAGVTVGKWFRRK